MRSRSLVMKFLILLCMGMLFSLPSLAYEYTYTDFYPSWTCYAFGLTDYCNRQNTFLQLNGASNGAAAYGPAQTFNTGKSYLIRTQAYTTSSCTNQWTSLSAGLGTYAGVTNPSTGNLFTSSFFNNDGHNSCTSTAPGNYYYSFMYRPPASTSYAFAYEANYAGSGSTYYSEIKYSEPVVHMGSFSTLYACQGGSQWGATPCPDRFPAASNSQCDSYGYSSDCSFPYTTTPYTYTTLQWTSGSQALLNFNNYKNKWVIFHFEDVQLSNSGTFYTVADIQVIGPSGYPSYYQSVAKEQSTTDLDYFVPVFIPSNAQSVNIRLVSEFTSGYLHVGEIKVASVDGSGYTTSEICGLSSTQDFDADGVNGAQYCCDGSVKNDDTYCESLSGTFAYDWQIDGTRCTQEVYDSDGLWNSGNYVTSGDDSLICNCQSSPTTAYPCDTTDAGSAVNGICVSGSQCQHSNIARDGGVYYSGCGSHPGKQCDSSASNGVFSQNGMCVYDGSVGYCRTTGYVFYSGTHYLDNTDVTSAHYDYDSDSNGKSCDSTITSGDYSGTGMVTTTGCTSGVVRRDVSNGNYFTQGCDSSGDPCDSSVSSSLTSPWIANGVCLSNSCVTGGPIVLDGGQTYTTCDGHGGKQCDSNGGYPFTQDGICYDDGSTGHGCATSGYVFYDGSNYLHSTQRTSSHYDSTSDSNGNSCDSTFTGGDYSANGMVTVAGCTSSSGVSDIVYIGVSDYFTSSCVSGSDDYICDADIENSLLSPFTPEGVCVFGNDCGTGVVSKELGEYYTGCNADTNECDSDVGTVGYERDGYCLGTSTCVLDYTLPEDDPCSVNEQCEVGLACIGTPSKVCTAPTITLTRIDPVGDPINVVEGQQYTVEIQVDCAGALNCGNIDVTLRNGGVAIPVGSGNPFFVDSNPKTVSLNAGQSSNVIFTYTVGTGVNSYTFSARGELASNANVYGDLTSWTVNVLGEPRYTVAIVSPTPSAVNFGEDFNLVADICCYDNTCGPTTANLQFTVDEDFSFQVGQTAQESGTFAMSQCQQFSWGLTAKGNIGDSESFTVQVSQDANPGTYDETSLAHVITIEENIPWALSTTDGGTFEIIDAGVTHTVTADTNVLDDNEWHHLVATYDEATGEMNLYVDGESASAPTTTFSGPLTTNTLDVNIGRHYATDSDYFYGTMDDVRIYNRALGSQEVTALHRLQGINYLDGLIAHYSFDKGRGNIAYDLSGEENDGTFFGDSNAEPEWIIGKEKSGLRFDGTTGIVIPPLSTNDRPSDSFTFAGWVNVDDVAEGVDNFVFWPQPVSTNDVGVGVSINPSEFILYEFGSSPTALHTVNLDASFEGWNHVAVVYDDKAPSLYLNGQQVWTGSSSGATSIHAPYELGSYHSGGHTTLDANRFEGDLDEVRLYARALEEEEIRALYLTDCTFYGKVSAPVNLTYIDSNGDNLEVILDHTGRFNVTNNQTEPMTISFSVDLASSQETYDPTSLDNDAALVAHWSMEGTGVLLGDDFAGNSYGVPGPVLSSDIDRSSILTLEGNDDYISFADDPAFDVTDITLTAWVKTGSPAHIVGRNGASFVLGTTNGGSFQIVNGGTETVYSAVSVNDGNWHHLAGTYNGTHMQIYVDGVLNGTHAYNGGIPLNDEAVYLGRSPTGIGSDIYFSGSLDEVYIFDEALLASEIKILAQPESPDSLSNLRTLYYAFENNPSIGENSQTVRDQTENGHFAYMSNKAYISKLHDQSIVYDADIIMRENGFPLVAFSEGGTLYTLDCKNYNCSSNTTYLLSESDKNIDTLSLATHGSTPYLVYINPYTDSQGFAQTSLEFVKYVGYGGSCLNHAWQCTRIAGTDDSDENIQVSTSVSDADIHIGSDGLPRIVYRTTSGTLRYVLCQDQHCLIRTETDIEGNYKTEFDLELNESNAAFIAVSDQTIGIRILIEDPQESDGFLKKTLVTNALGLGLSLTLNESVPHITYTSNSPNYYPYYAYCQSRNCEDDIVQSLLIDDTYKTLGQKMSITSLGHEISIAYTVQDSPNVLHYAVCTSSSCVVTNTGVPSYKGTSHVTHHNNTFFVVRYGVENDPFMYSLVHGTMDYKTGRQGKAVNREELSFELTTDHTATLESNTFGISLWVRPSDLEREQVIFTKYGSYTLGLNLETPCSSQTLCFVASISGDDATVEIPTSMLEEESWYHIALSFGHGTLEMYVDDVLVDTDADTGTLDTPSTPLCLGTSGDSSSCSQKNFNGRIDEFMIFNDALHSTQVEELYGAVTQPEIYPKIYTQSQSLNVTMDHLSLKKISKIRIS